jgi:SAM-dependent methyltransferase
MLAARQDTYWWHRARRRMSVELLRRHGAPADGTWVDLGCGPGGNLGIAAEFRARTSIGIDRSSVAIELARGRSKDASLIQADLRTTLPLRSESCDVVTIFNVLYHSWINSEIDVLTEVRRVLRPGGLVLITEPAFSALFRELDRAAMTRRRYRLRDIRDFCTIAHLETLLSNYFTSFGAPLLLIAKGVRFLQHKSVTSDASGPDMVPLPVWMNETLHALAAAEAAAITRGIRFPFGTTLVFLARRRP